MSTQSTVLAAGNTAAASSAIDVDAMTTIGLFTPSGGTYDGIPSGVRFPITLATPGDPIVVGTLDEFNPTFVTETPGSYTVTRPDISASGRQVGVFKTVAAA